MGKTLLRNCAYLSSFNRKRTLRRFPEGLSFSFFSKKDIVLEHAKVHVYVFVSRGEQVHRTNRGVSTQAELLKEKGSETKGQI